MIVLFGSGEISPTGRKIHDEVIKRAGHWNNTEGEDFDTTRCYMGKERFDTLLKLLPSDVTILGIDEQTACIIDVSEKTIEVMGKGSMHGVLPGFRIIAP